MHSTKTQILAALKRQGRCSVDELAAALGLAPMTVRQHLLALERDHQVASVEERRRLGRPHFAYFLTEHGEENFPRHYDRLAIQLLQEVGTLSSEEIAGLTPEEKTELLFDKLADRLVDRHRAAMEHLPFERKVAAVAELLHSESGFAEWELTRDGFEIRDYNCIYRRLSGSDDALCRWHQRILSGLLGSAVSCCSSSEELSRICRFTVADGCAQAAQLAGGARQPAARSLAV